MQFVAWVLLSLVVTGCGGRRFIDVTPDSAAAAPPRPAASRPTETLETFMAKVRKLSTEARPDRRQATTLEATYPELGAAIVAATAEPSPAAYRVVAAEYWRFRVFDKAHTYLKRALVLKPWDAATYDALARLWRDAGFPQLGLADAHRAVYHAPDSAAVRNTLGTLFQALGRRDLARAEYERALQIEPTASYALSNLCYAWVLDANAAKAIAACGRALELQPALTAAHHNLALAHAVRGDMAAAIAAFHVAGDRAQALYNTGVVHLAQRRYQSAITSFEAAQAIRPDLVKATALARQAAARATLTGSGE